MVPPNGSRGNKEPLSGKYQGSNFSSNFGSEQFRGHLLSRRVYMSAAYTSAMGVHLTYGHVPYRRASHTCVYLIGVHLTGVHLTYRHASHL